MKRKLFSSILFLLTMFGSITVSAAYCTTGLNTSGGTTYFDISAVSITSTTLNNTATRSTVYANSSCLNTFPASGTTTAILIPGSTYTINVTTTEDCIISVWIDYNQNGSFESTEWKQITTSSTINVPSSTTITIPTTAKLGITGLRIRSRLTSYTNDASSACLDMASGCTEDYTITIGSPIPAIPVADFYTNTTSVTAGNSTQFVDNTSGVPTSWSWSFPGGTPSTSTLQNPTVTYSTIGTYNVTLQATNSLGTNSSTKTSYINVVNTANVPATGSSSITTCGTTIYDNGGVSGSYSNSSNGTLVINPGTAGNAVKLTFNSFATESGYDYLYVYNGTSSSAPLLSSYNGSSIPSTITATNASGALTLVFTSDGSGTNNGFSISTSCVPLGQIVTSQSVYYASWTSIVDNNTNGYAQSKTLNYYTHNIGSTSSTVYAKLYYKLSAASTYTLLTTTSNFTANASSYSPTQTYSVSGLITQAYYDFKIELYDATNALIDTYDLNDDSDLSSEGFESSTLDGAVQTTQTVYSASWNSIIDNNSNGYVQSKVLNYYTYNSGSTTTSVYAKLYYKLSTASTYTLLTTSTSFSATSSNYSSTQTYTVSGLNTQAYYDFKIELYDATNKLLDTYDLNDDSDLSSEGFESAATDGIATYCVSGLAGYTFNISSVSISGTTLSNSATRPALTTTDGSYYTLFAASGSNTATLMPGSSYSINVTTTNSNIISAWIDFNQDNVFSTSEWVQITLSSASNSSTTASILIPSTAKIGQTRMRIRSRDSGLSNGSTDACSNFGSGCTEDYVVTIGIPTPAIPVASFSSVTSINKGGSVQFNDNTSGVPTSWNWTFEGGTPATSSSQSPLVVYSTPGIYKVILTASNALGTNTITKLNYITVNDIPSYISTASWSNINAVDNDNDGYYQSRKLSIDVNISSVSGSVSNTLKVFVKSTTDASYNLFKTVAPFTVTGTSSSDAQLIDFTGLPLGTYSVYIELYSSIGLLIDTYELTGYDFELASTDNVTNYIPYFYSVSSTKSKDNDADGYYQQNSISFYVYTDNSLTSNVSVKIYTKPSNSSTYVLDTTIAPFSISSSSSVYKTALLNGIPQGIYDIKMELYDANGFLVAVADGNTYSVLNNVKFELPITDVTGSSANNAYVSSLSWSNTVDVDADSYSESRVLNLSMYSNQAVNATIAISAKGTISNQYSLLLTKSVSLTSSTSTVQITIDNLQYNSYDFQIEILDATSKLIGVYDEYTTTLSNQQFEGGSVLTEEVSASEISVYPNPASEVLTVSLPNVKTATLIISDLYGKVILTKEITNGIITENVEALSGIYFVTVISEEGTVTKKVIIE